MFAGPAFTVIVWKLWTVGLLVPPGNTAALSRALRTLLDDARLRADLGGRARAFHDAFLDPGPYVERLIGVWRAVAEGRPDALECMNVSRYSSSSADPGRVNSNR